MWIDFSPECALCSETPTCLLVFLLPHRYKMHITIFLPRHIPWFSSFQCRNTKHIILHVMRRKIRQEKKDIIIKCTSSKQFILKSVKKTIYFLFYFRDVQIKVVFYKTYICRPYVHRHNIYFHKKANAFKHISVA